MRRKNMRSQYMLGLVLLLSGFARADNVVKTLYLDGVYMGQTTAEAALVYAYDRLIIGAEGGVGYRYNEYNGKIDEFAVYAGILNSLRITAHYNALYSDPNAYVNQVLSDNPLLYLRFEDPNSFNNSPAKNSGTANVNGTYIDSVSLSAGVAGKAAVFHGDAPDGAGDCVDVSDASGAFSLEDITIELWMQITADPNTYPRLFQHNGGWDSPSSYGVMLVDANTIGVIGGGTTNYFDTSGGVSIADGNWHHLVVTYDSTIEQITHKSYVEEVMDDNPVLYLRFEEFPLVDSSANSYWVAHNTGVQLSPFETSWGIDNSVYIPNSADNAVAAGPAAAMPADLTLTGDNYAFADGDITFEFWVNSTGMDAYATIFQQGRTELVAPGIGNSNGTLRILCGDDGNPDNNQNWTYTGAATPLDGKWHHIVLTYDEIDPDHMTIELYKDGAKVSTKAITSTTGQAKLGPELNHLVIGGTGTYTATNPGNRFSGLIDEFAVYAGVLSESRVATHYAAGLAAMKPKTCRQVWIKGQGLTADVDKDCDVDLTDFAAVASGWLLCNDPALFGTDPDCAANW